MRSRKFRSVLAALASGLLVAGCVVASQTTAAAAGPETLFGSTVPAHPSDPDTAKVELGVQFKASVAGKVTGLRFYKGSSNTGTHVGHLYGPTGTQLSSVTFTGETASGWQSATLASPVSVTAGTVYTASYVAPRGRYAADSPYAWPKVSGDLTGIKGTYKYGGGYPTNVYQASNYYVDVTFTPTVVVTTTPTTSSSTATTVSGTVVTTPTTTVVSTTPTTATTTGPPPSLTGWQLTTSNIGLAGVGLTCASLPVYSGSAKPASDTVINGMRITTPLDLSQGTITITRSCIKPTGIDLAVVTTSDFNGCGNNCPAPAKGQVTITDSEIDGSLIGQSDVSHDCAFLGVGILQRNYIHDTGSGICFYGTGSTYTGSAVNNYVDRMRAFGDGSTTGSHNETMTVRDYDGNRQLLISGNYLNINSGNDTGALFIQGQGGFIDNVTVKDNLLTGQGYQLILEAHNNGYGTHMNATNNRFSGTGFGVGYVTGGPGWASWTENYINDPTKPDNKGAAVGKP